MRLFLICRRTDQVTVERRSEMSFSFSSISWSLATSRRSRRTTSCNSSALSAGGGCSGISGESRIRKGNSAEAAPLDVCSFHGLTEAGDAISDSLGRSVRLAGPRNGWSKKTRHRMAPLVSFLQGNAFATDRLSVHAPALNSQLHRSHSPMTKSREPRILTTSLIMWPGRIVERIERFTKLGARIFKRCGVPPPLLLM